VELLERERELAAVEAVLDGGRLLVVEGGAGIGKTSLLEVACRTARARGHEVLRARGSELESGFALGVARQLFERRLAGEGATERKALLEGPAAAAALVAGKVGHAAPDASFAVLHGLYWLAVNMAARRSLVIAVDDAHWADDPSLHWLAYLAPRLEGLPVAAIVALRPAEPASAEAPLLAVRAEAATVVRPRPLSRGAVAAVARVRLGGRASDELCATLSRVSGGNPFYLDELVRAVERDGGAGPPEGDDVLAAGAGGLADRIAERVRRLDPRALALAQAVAVLGDGCELRHAAALAKLETRAAAGLVPGLVRVEVLAEGAPPRFLHPVVREAVSASLPTDRRDAAHLAAARLLRRDGAAPGQVGAHLVRTRPAGDPWVVGALREAAEAAMRSGAPRAAAALLRRALDEPPPPDERASVLRDAARAEAAAGDATALSRLEEAMALGGSPVERAEIALEVAEANAAFFRWVEAVDVLERALGELGDEGPDLAARLEGELVVAGLHDARRASRVGPVLERLAGRGDAGAPAEALAVARCMAGLLAGRPAEHAAVPLEAALAGAPARAENWDTRAALLWSLITAERFAAVERALPAMLAEARRSGGARALVATYSSLGLLELRLGALPEADAASRIALRVLQEGDLAAGGLAFAATVLADVAVEAGELEEAETLLALLPAAGWPSGVGTVLIPAARGRLRLAQGRPAEALAEFGTCARMFSADVWGMEMRDVGYLHARSGAALALLAQGIRAGALDLAEAELADARAFGGPRALGVALRVAGLALGGARGLELLGESVDVLGTSPALLERARSLAELGGALRRAGRRVAARDPLGEALDLAARSGARPLAARAREELRATGARPRREWRRGVEALTPSELRVARLAAEGRTNRQIAHGLYVTLKTVEGHLARAYAKLGIPGRAELAETLGEEKTRVPTRSRGRRESETVRSAIRPEGASDDADQR
jgi:DNA-binding CsgD family transcriptional regulator